MEASDREKRDRIIAHALAQDWLESLDAARKAGRTASQMTYDQLVKMALEGISIARQQAFLDLGKLPLEEQEAWAKKLDDCGLCHGVTRFPFPF